MHLADQVRRHLAGAEARHADLRRNALQLGIDLGIDILGRDLQRVGALQALVQRLDSLHFNNCLFNSGPFQGIGAAAALAQRDETGAGEGTRTPTS
ncbi:MAG: hypothetical protein ABI460_20910, partial [Caldimonas sp.]